jgi:DNA polymerase III subunit gamma/tau
VSRTVLSVTPNQQEQSTSLPTRHRPRSFATVVGQVHVVEVLRRAVFAGTVPQQLLFSGGSGLGKTTVARIVATALLCETQLKERDRGDACGTCPSCHDVRNGSHPDLIEFDAASHGGKDEIREIAARCQVLPLRAPVKVYVIDEAHGLSSSGGQAFLKLLEEPPAHVRFMLCTTDPDRMLKTNRGRCVEFELLPPTRREMVENLTRICAAEGWNAPAPVLDAVLDASDPDLGVRGTVTTLAKLATVLADGTNISPEMISALLGTPSPVAMRRLVTAIDASDRVAALRALEQARSSISEPALHAALLSWATRDVTASISGSPAGLSRALWRLELLLATRPATGWMDLTIAKLASPSLDQERGGRVLTEQALEALTGLEARLSAAGTTVSVATNGSSGETSPSPGVAQILAAASPASPELRALLPRCEVTVTADEVQITAPDDLVEKLKPLVPSLRTAAGRLGLPLKLRKASSTR